MKNIFLTFSLLFSISFADWYDNGDDGWSIVNGSVTGYTYNQYEDSMTGYVDVADSNGNNAIDQGSLSDGSDGDLVGVFDPNGGLRAVAASTLNNPFTGLPIFSIVAAGTADDNGSVFTFKFYDASTGAESDLDGTITFAVAGNFGGLPVPGPLSLSLSSGAPSGVDGCTDSSACNYNPSATDDDSSCTYADQYYTCDGDCINDTDNDTVCDELEVTGCTDSSACNYNSNATDNDGCTYSEQYYNCDGTCVNDADGNSVCDELESSDDGNWYDQGSSGWSLVNDTVTGYTYNQYEDSMTGYVDVTDSDGNNVIDQGTLSNGSDGDLVGVFDPNGGLRAVAASTLANPFTQLPIFSIVAAGTADDNGSVFTFKFYDASTGTESNLDGTITFTVAGNFGGLPAPGPVSLTLVESVSDGNWYDQGSSGWSLVNDTVTGYTYNQYEDSMTGYVDVTDSNGNNVIDQGTLSNGSDGDLVGVFDPNGGLRAVAASTLANPFTQLPIFSIVAAGTADDNGSVFTFKFYDASTGTESDLEGTITFTVAGNFGGLPAPGPVSLTLSGAPSGVDGCTDSAACNYNSSATNNDGSCSYPDQYYECDGTCTNDSDNDSVCDELEVSGCTDTAACNYNSSATDNDGCTYSDQYYECDGTCTNDSDNDSVCDELEVSGCTDASACNYDSNATDNDGCTYSDQYYECDGSCTNDADNDTVCDELELSGCTDINACNYNENATEDNGTCVSETNYYVDADGDGDGAGSATAYCPDDVPSSGVSLNNDDQDDACFTDLYQDWYVDLDGDGLGAGDATSLCTDTVSVDGSVTNNLDAEPDCATNDTDACGVCSGSNACAGCVDPNASNTNLEYLVDGTALDCSADSYTDLDDADTTCCVYTSFTFNQSMNQAAYFFTDIKIDGVSAEVGVDEIYAFKGDVCVGGGTWMGSSVEVMLMGNDGEQFTQGYLEPGDIPTFKIVDSDTGLQYNAVLNGVSGQFGDCAYEGYPGSVVSSLDENGITMSTSECETFPPFSNFTAYWDLGTAEAVKDCNDILGGNAYIDDCSDCVFSEGHNANDPDADTVCNSGAVNGEADNCPDTVNTNQANNDSDFEGDACDDDDDNDTVVDVDDNAPFDASSCQDLDGDTCDDCSQTMSGVNGEGVGPNTDNDGLDTDSDGACNAGDTDDDNDTVLDDVDSDSLDPSVCSDTDADGCDDCSETDSDNFSADDVNPQINNDGLDTDSDGACNVGDGDDDNDTVLDSVDTDSLDPSICSDTDNDGCDDCSQTASNNFSADDTNPQVDNDGDDNDSDGACDLGDDDDDNDNVLDNDDLDQFNPSICQDLDSDTCDDCSGTDSLDFSGTYPDVSDDGDDNDSDGECDLGDADDDNDTVLDVVDANKNESSICEDSDGDGCDDCSQTMSGSDGQNIGPDTDDDGADNDDDGACDVGDADDDNDGVDDGNDSAPFESSECQDLDGDTCDDCSQTMSGADGENYGPTPNEDGADNDSDGLCDDGDVDDDNDSVEDDSDDAPFDPSSCEDSDNDTCDDCSANSPTDFSGVTPDTLNDGDDNDSDGACDNGDADDDNDTVDDSSDSDPFDPTVCEDSDNDTCDDCSQSANDFSDLDTNPNTLDDGFDYDGDGACDAGDEDDDNDNSLDDDDSDDNNEYICSDTDEDSCEDCQSGAYDPSNDGVDYDSDTLCDAGDSDDDDDNVLDADDDCDPDSEGLDDSDFGEDLSSLGWTSSAVTDHDSDGCSDVDEDLDDDNDGQSDATDECDPDDTDAGGVDFSQKDWDSDNPSNDYDNDGCLDTASEDNDDDNDGVLDISDDCDPDTEADGDTDFGADASDLNWSSFATTAGGLGTDHDQDGCQDNGEDADDDNDQQGDSLDDCDPDNLVDSEIGWDSSAQNADYDDDGCQDSELEDLDDDNDGIADADDYCATGELGWNSNSTTDFDGDGCLDASTEDVDDDNDGACDALSSNFEPGYTGPPCVVVGDGDIDDNNPNLCSDTDLDGCEDCLSGLYNTANDGDDDDSDGHCNIGDVDIVLNQGANSVSFYALPSSGNYGVDNIFGDAGDSNDISKIFGEGSIAFNLEDLGNWVGSLQDISSDDGYWVISDQSSALEVQGYPTFIAGVDYLLHEGNNFVSYPYFYGNSLESALPASATDNLAYIYGEGTSALVLPNGSLVGSLANTGFSGSKGYWFGATVGFSFEYNEPNSGLGRYVNRELPQVPVELAFKQSTEQYFYFIQEAQVEGMDLAHGDWIVAYNNDVVVGARQYDSNAIMVDVPIMGTFTGTDLRSSVSSLTSGYCEPGDIPLIKIHRTNGEIVEMFATVVEGSLAFSGMGHAIVTLSDVNFPQEVSLHNAYPNPFNPSTMIQYDLPQGSMHVNLSVFDIRGRLVSELVNEIQSGASDSYSVMWNADTHSSGMYFVQLRAGNTVVNQKIMLLK